MWLRVVRQTAELIPEIAWQLFWEVLMLLSRLIAASPWVVRTALATGFVWCLRAQVDTFWTWFQWNVWFYHKRTIGHDGLRLSSGIETLESVSYGAHRLEKMHRLVPTAEHTARSRGQVSRHMLYIHGGGFVFASSAVLVQSVTPFVRKGYTAYSMDYPLAPENRFPAPLVSTLRALAWLHDHEGIDSIVLLGDSAGASLGTMAAAIAMNRGLLEEFAAEAGLPEMLSWSFPTITRMGSLYGLLDQQSWRGRQLKQISMLENFMAEGGIAGCLELYASRSGVFGNRLCLMDIVDSIEHFPPTVFIGGSMDPLVYSTIVAHDALARAGHDVHCKIVPGRHGFYGLPVEWTFGHWVNDAKPAFELLSSFFGIDRVARSAAESSAAAEDLFDDADNAQHSKLLKTAKSPSKTRLGHRRRRSRCGHPMLECCLVAGCDYGVHALRAYDQQIGEAEPPHSDDEDFHDVDAALLLQVTRLQRA